MRTFRTILYFSLLAVSAFTLLSRPYLLEQIRAEKIAAWWILTGPLLFGVLFLIYMIDELNRSKKQTHQSKHVLLTLIFGLIVLVFLLPSSFREYKTRTATQISSAKFLNELWLSKDARVRTLVIMAASCQIKTNQEWTKIIELGLSDLDPMVQNAAKIALQEHLGIELNHDHSLQDAKGLLEKWKNSL